MENARVYPRCGAPRRGWFRRPDHYGEHLPRLRGWVQRAAVLKISYEPVGEVAREPSIDEARRSSQRAP